MKRLEYIMSLYDKLDNGNIQFEEVIIDRCTGSWDKMNASIYRWTSVYNDISTQLKLEQLLMKINGCIDIYINEIYRHIMGSIGKYYEMAYKNQATMIDIAINGSSNIREIMEDVVNDNTLAHMRDHAFNYVTGISNEMKRTMRNNLQSAMVQGKVTYDDIVNIIQSTMGSKICSRDRAKLIAQTELSMAYNSGSLKRMNEYNKLHGDILKKYWYGFKHSVITCEYCRPRIGTWYELGDITESLPAHPRCRCVWIAVTMEMIKEWERGVD